MSLYEAGHELLEVGVLVNEVAVGEEAVGEDDPVHRCAEAHREAVPRSSLFSLHC